MTAPISRLSNSFTMANAIVDLDLRHMSGNALKCYVVIVRKTTGWNKVTDRISIRQFMDFSGIERRETVSKALRELEAMGLIVRHERSGKITEYSLNFEEPTHTDEPSHPEKPTHPEKPSDTHTDKPSDTPPKKPYTTKDTVTKDTVTKDTRLGARATADDDQPKFSDLPPEPPPPAKPKRQSREEAFVAFVVERGVDEETARCWWQYRDGKPMTSKAWERHCAQADAAGISPQAAADYTAGRGWAGFYANSYLREMEELAQIRQRRSAPQGRVFDQAGNPQGEIVPVGMLDAFGGVVLPVGRMSKMSQGLAALEEMKAKIDRGEI